MIGLIGSLVKYDDVVVNGPTLIRVIEPVFKRDCFPWKKDDWLDWLELREDPSGESVRLHGGDGQSVVVELHSSWRTNVLAKTKDYDPWCPTI